MVQTAVLSERAVGREAPESSEREQMAPAGAVRGWLAGCLWSTEPAVVCRGEVLKWWMAPAGTSAKRAVLDLCGAVGLAAFGRDGFAGVLLQFRGARRDRGLPAGKA